MNEKVRSELNVPEPDARDRGREVVEVNRAPSRATKRTVRQGLRYRATLSLGFFEQLASNALLAGKFAELGFEDVKVIGEGAIRTAEALWPLPDADGDCRVR